MPSKYNLSPQKERLLINEMKRLKIKESDIRERFVRARGPGGQKVNKTSSCVYLKHLPSGIEVKCQRERSQAANRFMARCILLKKIERMAADKKLRDRQGQERLRRAKRKRSPAAKEKILRQKRLRSEKKRGRLKTAGFAEE